MRSTISRFALTVLLAISPLAMGQNVVTEKYALPNGMKVILHEDHTLPVASINIWYSVGAQDEPPGRSGFAHLFEHLMFMGTRRVPGNQFDVLMETGGGANNANTDLHRTNYYSWGPSKLLPTLLWLDADRLEEFGLNVTQEKLDKQRDVVRNELRQNVENAPYGKADESIWKMLFPADHPYVHGVIGTHEDLEAATVANVRDFFANFYVPRNACLVVAGDFRSEEIKPLIDGLFGTIEAGAPVMRKYAQPGKSLPMVLSEDKRFTSIDQVELPRVQFTFLSPIGFGEGDAQMKIAASLLANGKSARLTKRLVVDEQIAVDVSAAQQGYPLAGIFQVNVFMKPGVSFERVEAIIREELLKLTKADCSESELSQAKVEFELGILSAMEAIESKAASMNEYEAAWGDPNGFSRDIARFREATPQQVRMWCEQVFTAGRVITRVLPDSPSTEPSHRDAPPKVAEDAPFSIPAPERFTLSNGLEVALWSRPELPKVAMRLMLKPGGGLDPISKPGLASLAAQMLEEGAGARDAVAFAQAMRDLGAEFSSNASEEILTLSMSCLSRSVGPASELFADALLRPRLTEEDFSRVKAALMDELLQLGTVPAVAAERVASRLLYGERNPYSTPAMGTSNSVEALSLGECKDFISKVYGTKSAVLLIAGDITKERAVEIFEPLLGQWKAEGSPGMARGESMRVPSRSGQLLAIVDRPGSTQTFVRFAMPGTSFDDPRRVQLDLFNIVLGGSFTSRLNQNLREEHGYTYGARSAFAMEPSTGSFLAGASVGSTVTGPALEEFLMELTRARNGDLTDEETFKARETARNELIRGFGSLDGLLGSAASRLAAGIPPETATRDLAVMGRTSTKELNTIASQVVTIDDAILVLVGDKAVILEQIKDLKLPSPQFFDSDGNPLKDETE